MATELQQLVDRANKAGTQASAQTGIAFNPLDTTASRNAVSSREPAGQISQPTIPVDSLGVQQSTPTLPTPPSPNTRVAQQAGMVTPSAQATTQPEQPEQPSLKQRLESQLSNLLGKGNQIDTVGLREELRINEKAKLATDLENKLLQSKQNYDNQIIELEKNKSGKLRANLNAEINKFSQDANRDLAQQSISYKIANDDYAGAEKIYNDRVSDLKEQRAYEMQVFNTAWNFVQNDLTESEKVQVQQAFQVKQDEKNFEQQKELAELQGAISRQNAQFSSDLKVKEEQASVAPINPVQVSENITRVNSLISDIDSIKSASGQFKGKKSVLGSLLNPLGLFTKPIQTVKDAATVTKRLNAFDDFLSKSGKIINDQTFQKLTDLKAGGATFGSLTEGERIAIGKAASDFAASAEIDPQTGFVTGFRGSEQQLKDNLAQIQKGYLTQQDIVNAQALGSDDILEIFNVSIQ